MAQPVELALVWEKLLSALSKAPESAEGILSIGGTVTHYVALSHHALEHFEVAARLYAQLNDVTLAYVAASALRMIGNVVAARERLQEAVNCGLPDAADRLEALAPHPKPAAELVSVQTSDLPNGTRIMAFLAKTTIKGGQRKSAEVALVEGGVNVLIEFHDGSVYSQFVECVEYKHTITHYKVELTLRLTGAESAGVVQRPNILREVARPENPYLHKNPTRDMETQEEDGGEAGLQQLFQKMYADADDDTKRAMMKSYQTSGGTCLSTHWPDVRDKDYERDLKAPDGQEVRRWN